MYTLTCEVFIQISAYEDRRTTWHDWRHQQLCHCQCCSGRWQDGRDGHCYNIRLDVLSGRACVCVVINAFHHLRLSSSHKGSVFVKERSDSQEEAIRLLKDNWSLLATDLAPRILPSGLSPYRQWYLYNKIREFWPDQCKDHTCPKPCELGPPSGSLPTTLYKLHCRYRIATRYAANHLCNYVVRTYMDKTGSKLKLPVFEKLILGNGRLV